MDSKPLTTPAVERACIEARIPHRPPFLFVTRVLAVGPEGITTEWEIDPAADFFAGHYPAFPLVPGVLISEFVFQSAALYMSEPKNRPLEGGTLPVLSKIENARFRAMVRPGETLRAEVSLVEKLGPARYMKAVVTSAGKSVMRISFVVALAELENAPPTEEAR